MTKLTIGPKPHHLIQSKALPAAHGGWELERRRVFRAADSRLVIYTCVIIYLASSFTHVGMLARKCTEKRLQIVSRLIIPPLFPFQCRGHASFAGLTLSALHWPLCILMRESEHDRGDEIVEDLTRRAVAER